MFELDIVVPTLNEARQLPGLCGALAKQQDLPYRLIVSDGGSGDSTIAIARRWHAKVVTGARGRGQQMNRGAAASDAPYLLFLHADSRPGSTTQLRRALDRLVRINANARHDRHAGHFPLKFRRRDARHDFFYRYLEYKSALNRAETFNGDQGLLLSRGFFDELDGFPQRLPFLEDQLIGEKIRQRGEFLTLPGRLLTSARRFEAEGTYRRYFLMTLIMSARRLRLQSFFEGAEALYRQQDQAHSLDIRPVFELFLTCVDQADAWSELGAYSLENLWQLCLASDLALGTDGRLLNWHDRWLRTRLSRHLSRQLAGQLLRVGIARPLRWSLSR